MPRKRGASEESPETITAAPDPVAAISNLLSERDTLRAAVTQLKGQLKEQKEAVARLQKEHETLAPLSPLLDLEKLLYQISILRGWRLKDQGERNFGPMRRWWLSIEGKGRYYLQLNYLPEGRDPDNAGRAFAVMSSHFKEFYESIAQGLKTVDELDELYEKVRSLATLVKTAASLSPSDEAALKEF